MNFLRRLKKLKSFPILYSNSDFLGMLGFSLVTLGIFYFSQSVFPQSGVLDFLRIIFGIFYITIPVGYVWTTFLFPDSKEISILERFLFSVGISLFALYPAGFLNVLWEGRAQIYSSHLMGDMLFLSMVLWGSMGIVALHRLRTKKAFDFKAFVKHPFPNRKILWGVVGILALGLYLRVTHLGDPNLNQDEFEIGYRAYDLVDGIQAGRKAYFLSATDHSPLGFYIVHFFWNIISPQGFYSLSEIGIRIPTVILGMLSLIGGAILAFRLFKNYAIALFTLFLLSIDNYSIFASRLTVPQDLGYFTFFVILALLAVKSYLEKPNVKHAIWLGVWVGMVFLIKFSAILLLPLVVILIVGYGIFSPKEIKVRWLKHLSLSLFSAFLIFSPVVFFYAATYMNANYLDVPFSKMARILNIEVNSVMPDSDIYGSVVGNPFPNMKAFAGLLIDEWNLLFAILMGIGGVGGIIIMMKSKNNKEQRMGLIILIVFIGVSFLFFILNGFHVYYAPFLSIPMTILASVTLVKAWRKYNQPGQIFMIILVLVVSFYTILYTYNTHARVSEWKDQSEQGRSGMEAIKPDFLVRNYSISALSSLNDREWDELQNLVQVYVDPEDILLLDPDLSDLLVRWYLHSGDEVQRYYSGENYHSDYSIHWLDESLSKTVDSYPGKEIYMIDWVYDDKLMDFSGAIWMRSIFKKDGTEVFRIYQLKN